VGLVPLPQGVYSNDSDADKKFEAFGYVDLEKFRLVLEENNYSVFLISYFGFTVADNLNLDIL
jgi:hypothetical protein